MRVKAASIHFICCLLVASLFSVVVFVVWYPAPLHTATGVTHIFLMIVLVDIIIGPLITFVVYNPQKKELKRDLITVVLLQLAALFYGMNVVYMGRPVYFVFSVDRFELVQAIDLDQEKLAVVEKTEFKSLPLWGAEWIVAVKPTDPDERQKLLFDALAGGDDLPYIPKYYDKYEFHREVIKSKLLNIETLQLYNKDGVVNVQKKFMHMDVGYLPLRSAKQDMVVILDKKTVDVLAVMDLRPW